MILPGLFGAHDCNSRQTLKPNALISHGIPARGPQTFSMNAPTLWHVQDANIIRNLICRALAARVEPIKYFYQFVVFWFRGEYMTAVAEQFWFVFRTVLPLLIILVILLFLWGYNGLG